MNQNSESDGRLLYLREFNQAKFNPLFPIYEIGVDRAQIAYWRREGLLPFIEKGKWAKVSCVEAIWIMMLDSLRSFGVSTRVMQKLTDYFIKRAYTDNVPKKNLEGQKKELEKKKLAGNMTTNEKARLDYVKDLLKDEARLHSFKWDINYFSNLITESIVTSSEAAVLIFIDGRIVEESLSGYRTYPETEEIDFSAPHVKVSLIYYLRQFIQKEEMEGFLALARLFSEDEERVLREMKNRNVRELNIKLHNGKIERIESTKAGQITGEQAEKVRKILGMKNYQSITLDTRDEKTLSFKLTNKRKR
jgi:hypothetical protein